MSAPSHGRQRTRWIQLIVVAGLSALVTGVVVLENLAPEADPSHLAVAGVPPLALEDERSCTRRPDDTIADELRDAFPTGGRIGSTQVHACPRAFDGLEVAYAGEVIGEVLPRRGGAWAQVNDDVYALEVGPLVGHRERAGFNTGLSVWLPDPLPEEIDGVGRPGQRGDVILVHGTLLRADPEDGGGITVRAKSVEVLDPARAVEDPLHVVQAIVAAVLALLAVTALVWSRQARRR